MQILLCQYFLQTKTLDFLVTDKFLEKETIHFFYVIRYYLGLEHSLALCSVFYMMLVCVSLTNCKKQKTKKKHKNEKKADDNLIKRQNHGSIIT